MHFSFPRKIPLLQLLILGLVLPLVGAVGLIEYLAWKNQQQTVEQLVGELQQRVGNRIEEHLSYFTDRPTEVTELTLRALQRGDLSIEDLRDWQPYLFDQGDLFNTLSYLYFGNATGDYIELSQLPDREDLIFFRDHRSPQRLERVSAQQPGLTTLEVRPTDYDPRQRPWYQAAATGQAQWTDIYEFTGADQGLGIK